MDAGITTAGVEAATAVGANQAEGPIEKAALGRLFLSYLFWQRGNFRCAVPSPFFSEPKCPNGEKGKCEYSPAEKQNLRRICTHGLLQAVVVSLLTFAGR